MNSLPRRELTDIVKALNGLVISFEFRKHVGPRYIHGAVTLSFEAAPSYSFHALATWPTRESYAAAVEETVQQELTATLGEIPTVKVSLTQVTWREVDSSEDGFRRAAAAAVAAALRL